MNLDEFWTSQDGQILTVRNQDDRTVGLTLAFWPRRPAELEFFKSHGPSLQFTERSSLARIGIEMLTRGTPRLEGNRLELDAEAFLYDPSFPDAPYWKKLLRSGTPVGRLFHAPAAAKLSTQQIWDAVKANRLKLPDTISIDRLGRVYLTTHQVSYTLNPKLQRLNFERIVSGNAGRSFLDKIQIRHDASPLTIPPHSGILTSCSMFLKEHFVVLNQGEGNFGIHTAAVLLDPIKTFGTNVMLEIYNSGDQPVVNPMVSVEVFRAPEADDPQFKTLQRKRQRLLGATTEIYKCLDERSPRDNLDAKPKTKITVRNQSATMENRSLLVRAGDELKKILADNGGSCGHRTMIQALDAAPENADTLIVDYLPDLLEHIELVTRIGDVRLKRIIFRKASRTHGYFLSSNAHARLDMFDAIGLQVNWYDELTQELYTHVYKKEHGFFVREEMSRRFQEATILAFYGSAVGLEGPDTARIAGLVDKLTGFFGENLGVLTGGGGGVMRLATEQARGKGALTGACFLELEAQPPELGVDFFNTFQEASRHFRQKWFEAADFCIFNVGGVGTLEEVGIELCNLKLGIRPRVPYVFFNARFWGDLRKQLREMIRTRRAPAWIADYVLFTDDPDEVVAFYRKTLQVL
ncbi:LOG family protein [Opitutus terrae]|uniref:AMP nucleosidase n=1 Tax=Opitutus terrae (strain DSM 11246 / JCM 15787 / PB90-1) TaxID=452637 RepID=B1ZZW4_OPITP|nr:LOG family protein [Opitutus terrae]ACB77297.1 Rossmann fold nucleotide-binding protein-like protein [Opitutus terrae PB90-1]